MAVAVAVVLAVGFVVLVVVRHQVVQREAVVRGDEVDARGGPLARPAVQVFRTGDALGHLADEPAVAFPEAAQPVAVLVVPLGPAEREVADLVAAVAQVPRFGDELHAVERRVLPDRVEEAAEVLDLA
ncbi:hypothetical protein FQZ97_1076520 [compost metagenome]